MLFSVEIRDTSTSDHAVVQEIVLSAMAQDFYILLAKKKSIFSNLLNVLTLIQLGPQIVG